MAAKKRALELLGMTVIAAFCATYSSRAAADEKKAEPVKTKPRGEFFVGLGTSVGLTDWAGDPAGYGSFGIGLRLFEVVMPFAEARVGYGRIDQRLLTFLSLGVAGTFHPTPKIAPRILIGAVHQHEESLAAVAQEPAGALLGIGGGIRHRAGVQLGLACDFTVYQKEKFIITVGPELRGAYLTYSSGPSWYGQIGAVASGYFRLF
jgi:hypothetical protein